MEKMFLGIDTSNYTTSVAIVNEKGQVISEKRKILEVKKGNRGLRQSEAFYQHIMNFPNLYDELANDIPNIKEKLKAICVSSKPRNIEGSYMPVFNSGVSFANVISKTLEIPMYTTSHQEGHIMAVKHFSEIDNKKFICFHLSGGTSEILLVEDELKTMNISIIGRTLDISFGQLLDRIGVMLGYEFPSGNILDEIVTNSSFECIKAIKNIHINDLNINLSGIETQILNVIDVYDKKDLVGTLFTKISLCLQKLIDECKNRYGDISIVFVGGVSKSIYLQNIFKDKVVFGEYASDNAVGTAIIGGIKYGTETYKGKSIK